LLPPEVDGQVSTTKLAPPIGRRLFALSENTDGMDARSLTKSLNRVFVLMPLDLFADICHSLMQSDYRVSEDDKL